MSIHMPLTKWATDKDACKWNPVECVEKVNKQVICSHFGQQMSIHMTLTKWATDEDACKWNPVGCVEKVNKQVIVAFYKGVCVCVCVYTS